MVNAKETKRENFDVSPQQQADIETLQAFFESPSKKEAVMLAVQITLHLAAETKNGNQIFVGHPGEQPQRFVLTGLERPALNSWTYLVEHRHPWKRQLFVKGRKLSAASVWSGMEVNRLSIEEAMDNWDLPYGAIQEILQYCETNKQLLKMEADEEERLLNEKGISVGRETARR